MRKYFCDRCGKEVDKAYFLLRFSPRVLDENIGGRLEKQVEKIKDFEEQQYETMYCPDCAEQIIDFIERTPEK